MPKLLAISLVLFLAVTAALAQNRVELTILGENQIPLEAATIVGEHGGFWITNSEGQVQINGKRGLIVKVSHVGYFDLTDTLDFDQDALALQLIRNVNQLQEVVIDYQQDQILQNPTDQVVFSLNSISEVPLLMGVADPIKFVQLHTGVSTGTEGNNGYFVRGGGIDQNAITLDRMELYNPNHLLGFFSMFNPRAIDRATFIKSGYPAEYGGRLSSVLDIRTADPDLVKFSGGAGIGLLAVDAYLNTPIIENKLGIQAAYRRSYLDLITQSFFESDSRIRQSTDYKFSDFIGKIYWQPNEKNNISLTFFTGMDKSHYQSSRTFSNDLNWKTMNLGFSWIHQFNSNSLLETYSNLGAYNQRFSANISSYEMHLNSSISNWKTGLIYAKSLPSQDLVFGLEWNQRWFIPNEVDVLTGRAEFVLQESSTMPTGEWAIFGDDWIQINEQFKIGIGLRLSGFLQFGPFTRYAQDQNSEIKDSVVYNSAQIVESYWGWEPRLRLSYLLNPENSLKLSYDRNYQYIHLSPLSSVSLPSDLWIPSTSVVRPQLSDQLAITWSQITKRYLENFSLALFGKKMQNQMEWKNGVIAGYSDSPNLDDDLIFGRGYAYGLELKASKEKEKFSWNVNYTLSKTMRVFEELNDGLPFPAKYDRTHDLNLTLKTELGNWVFAGMFKLASGTTLTLPKSKYLIGERVVSQYTQRNALRMPIYHRVDLSATLHPKNHPRSKWVFSIYNLYNRDNPYFIYFDVQGSVTDYSLDINLNQVSLFPILPSVSYEVHF